MYGGLVDEWIDIFNNNVGLPTETQRDPGSLGEREQEMVSKPLRSLLQIQEATGDWEKHGLPHHTWMGSQVSGLPLVCPWTDDYSMMEMHRLIP